MIRKRELIIGTKEDILNNFNDICSKDDFNERNPKKKYWLSDPNLILDKIETKEIPIGMLPYLEANVSTELPLIQWKTVAPLVMIERPIDLETLKY